MSFVGKFARYWLDRYFGPFATKQDLNNLYAQFAALLEVKDMVGPGAPLGPLRGWAISPDALAVVLRDIQARQAPKVLEFGAGESTIAIASALRRRGEGSLVTVEHDPNFLRDVSLRISAQNLDAFVDLRLIELSEYPPRGALKPFRSYDLAGFEVPFDVALVDGPIASTFGAGARLGPLDWCVRHADATATIYLDDAARPGEQEVLELLSADFPDLKREAFNCEKGLVRIASS